MSINQNVDHSHEHNCENERYVSVGSTDGTLRKVHSAQTCDQVFDMIFESIALMLPYNVANTAYECALSLGRCELSELQRDNEFDEATVMEQIERAAELLSSRIETMMEEYMYSIEGNGPAEQIGVSQIQNLAEEVMSN